jgi:hypothetical protein
MTDQQTPPPAPAPNATEAQAKIDTLMIDQGWIDRFMKGEPTAVNEYHTLTGAAVDGGSAEDVVASVLTGKGPQFGNSVARQMTVAVEQFRELGISDGVTKEFLSGHKVTPQEYQAVASLKRELMSDPEFVKDYLGGNVKANQRMTTINAVLVNGVKVEA